jgi:hypothetical protein
MADAPQVAHTSPYPESYQKYDQAPEHYDASQHSPASAHNLYHPTPYVEKPRQDTILGIRRRNFWILVILAIVISAVVIGASVGGSLAVRKAGYVVFLLRLERRLYYLAYIEVEISLNYKPSRPRRFQLRQSVVCLPNLHLQPPRVRQPTVYIFLYHLRKSTPST